MTRRLPPFLLSLALAAAPAIAQRPPPPQAGAAPFARRLQHLVGQRQGPVMLAAVHAEGNVLVFTLNGGIGWRAFVPVAALTRAQLARHCQRPEVRGFFNGRRLLRVDTTELGRNRWPGQPVGRCP
ncbi:MAG TPA: hypothetical protein VMG08_18265 [Allosphingosinicella sp.]|nr:hypothetical protein [Allosphingosinicella sp.]